MRPSAIVCAPCLLFGFAVFACSTPRPAARPGAALPNVPIATRPGETACQAAGRLGVSVETIRAKSKRVPARPLRHRVQPGETLSRVAAWYGHEVHALARTNAITDPNWIAAGDQLRIPAGARTGCPPPAVAMRAKRAPAAPAVSSAPPRRAAAAPRSRAVQRARAVHGPAPELLARADDRLESAVHRYDQADFRAALTLARSAGDLLAAQPSHPAVVERRARAAWLVGLSHAGLDERQDAALALREAIALRPALRTDPRLSPRIASLLEGEPTVEANAAAAD